MNVNREQKLYHLRKLLATREYRGLSNHLIAVELKFAHGCTTAMVETLTGLKRDAQAAAMKAVQEGRVPGVNGRPRAYNAYEQQKTMEQVIEKLEANEEVNKETVRFLVSEDFGIIFKFDS